MECILQCAKDTRDLKYMNKQSRHSRRRRLRTHLRRAGPNCMTTRTHIDRSHGGNKLTLANEKKQKTRLPQAVFIDSDAWLCSLASPKSAIFTGLSSAGVAYLRGVRAKSANSQRQPRQRFCARAEGQVTTCIHLFIDGTTPHEHRIAGGVRNCVFYPGQWHGHTSVCRHGTWVTGGAVAVDLLHFTALN